MRGGVILGIIGDVAVAKYVNEGRFVGVHSGY